jgi:hypothetical protein
MKVSKVERETSRPDAAEGLSGEIQILITTVLFVNLGEGVADFLELCRHRFKVNLVR